MGLGSRHHVCMHCRSLWRYTRLAKKNTLQLGCAFTHFLLCCHSLAVWRRPPPPPPIVCDMAVVHCYGSHSSVNAFPSEISAEVTSVFVRYHLTNAHAVPVNTRPHGLLCTHDELCALQHRFLVTPFHHSSRSSLLRDGKKEERGRSYINYGEMTRT